MKTITKHEHELILTARAEGLTGLPPSVFEKDLLLTEVLRSIDSIDADGVEVIFCGGTCLAKAYGVIDRMSEDIDFKLKLPKDLSRSTRSRVLSQFKKRVATHFEGLGFAVPIDQIVARDENRYVCMNLLYKSRFPRLASLRSEIKIELNARPPVLPTSARQIRSMLEVLLGNAETYSLIECVGVEETLAEKVLSFLRRTGEMKAGRHRADYDGRLVRHLYDVTAIVREMGDLSLPLSFFERLVLSDGLQFQRQYPEFVQDPVGEMHGVLRALQEDSEQYERVYREFVDELVFGETVKFDEARAIFSRVATEFIANISSEGAVHS